MKRAPRIAAIQDISGFGRCSTTVVLPVLAAMGGECCPLLTACLSAHTAFPASEKATFLDLTGQMAGTAAHWAELGVTFDAIYSGFLGSAGQIGLIEDFYRQFRREGTLVLVDPVMGDHGKPYRTYTPELCGRMRDLAAQADVITPNLTEAALLLEEDYADLPRDEEGLRAWLERLSLDGRRSVVLTGVSLRPGAIGAGCFDRAHPFCYGQTGARPVPRNRRSFRQRGAGGDAPGGAAGDSGPAGGGVCPAVRSPHPGAGHPGSGGGPVRATAGRADAEIRESPCRRTSAAWGFVYWADWSRRVSRRSRRTACSRGQYSTGRPSTRSKNAAACRAKRSPGGSARCSERASPSGA